VVFPANSHAGAAFGQTALHPTQLYTSVIGFSVMLALLLLERRFRGMGQLFGLYLMLEGAGRVAVDFVRAYPPAAYVVPGITAHQLIALGLSASGLFLLVRASPPSRRTPGSPTGSGPP
jgi:phosphatidylglycerol:prolipoprotein diacylglycerol transferase